MIGFLKSVCLCKPEKIAINYIKILISIKSFFSRKKYLQFQFKFRQRHLITSTRSLSLSSNKINLNTRFGWRNFFQNSLILVNNKMYRSRTVICHIFGFVSISRKMLKNLNICEIYCIYFYALSSIINKKVILQSGDTFFGQNSKSHFISSI